MDHSPRFSLIESPNRQHHIWNKALGYSSSATAPCYTGFVECIVSTSTKALSFHSLCLCSLLPSVCSASSISLCRSVYFHNILRRYLSPALCVSAVLFSISVPLCVCVLTVCVHLPPQCVHQPSHYSCLFLHLFASLGTARNHWGQQALTPAPIYPSLSCVWVFCQYNALCISQVTHYLVSLPFGTYFPLHLSSVLHLLPIHAHGKVCFLHPLQL